VDEQRPFENTKNLHRQKAASVTLILADLCSSVFFLVLESERFSRLLSLNFPAFSLHNSATGCSKKLRF
ncbi:hypothetical protein Csa_023991, partial [Cucumis sativus]